MNLFNLTSLQIGNTVFLDPVFLYIGLCTCFVPYLFVRLSHKKEQLEIGFFQELKQSGFHFSFVYILKHVFAVVSYIAFFVLFANPHDMNVKEKISKDGIDIVLALDVSKSMEATDLKPTRIEAAKKVISDFIEEIESDRVGLVIFAGKPYSSLPLTYDYSIITETLGNLTTDSLNQNINGLDGTAIGDALLLSSKLLEGDESESEQREKIIILLTDGDANRGVDPILAVNAVADKKIKTYSIGVGSKEGGTIKIQNGPFIQEQKIAPLNESVLREIAKISDAKFYRATDNSALENIFSQIATLEKTELETEVEVLYKTKYSFFLIVLLLPLLGLFTLQALYKN